MKKIIATVTCAAFLHSQVLGAVGSPDFWRDRAARREKPAQMARLPSAPSAPHAVQALAPLLPRAGASLTTVNPVLPDWLGAVPSSIGSVQEVSLPPSSKPLIIHIRDLHDQAAAQKNISGLVSFLAGAGVRVAGLEGVAGPLPLEAYRALPDAKTTEVLADYFLETAALSGPEHAALTSARSLGLRGVEDAALYKAHVAAFRRASALEELAQAMVSRRRAELDLAAEDFPAALREFHRRSFAYHSDGEGLTGYVDLLAGAPGFDPAAFPVVRRFMAAARLEDGVDFSAAEEQRVRLLHALAERLDDAALADLTSAALAYRLGHLSHGDFYARLGTLCAAHGLRLESYPAFAKYLEYAASTDGLSPDALLADVEKLEQAVRRRLAADGAQREFLETSRDVQLLWQLCRYALPSEKWPELRSRRDRLARGEAAPLIEPFEDFMRLGLERDAAIARNLSALAAGEKAVVLVAGGFHTAGLTALWRREKTPFVVLAPRTGPSSSADGTAYLDAFRRDAAPLEKFLAGEKVFLKSAHVVSPESPMNAAFERFWAALYAGESSWSGELGDREALRREWTALFKGFGAVDSLETSGDVERRDGVLRLPLKITDAATTLDMVLQLGSSAKDFPKESGRTLREGTLSNGHGFRIVVPGKTVEGGRRWRKAAHRSSPVLSRLKRVGLVILLAAGLLGPLALAYPIGSEGPAVAKSGFASFFSQSGAAQASTPPGPVAVRLSRDRITTGDILRLEVPLATSGEPVLLSAPNVNSALTEAGDIEVRARGVHRVNGRWTAWFDITAWPPVGPKEVPSFRFSYRDDSGVERWAETQPAAFTVGSVLTPGAQQIGLRDIEAPVEKSVLRAEYVAGWLGVLLALWGLRRWWVTRRLDEEEPGVPAAADRESAYQAALRRLAELERSVKAPEQEKAFYEELSETLSEFLVNFEGLPPGARNTGTLLDDLAALQRLSPLRLNDVRRLLDKFEEARFSNRPDAPDERLKDLEETRIVVDAIAGRKKPRGPPRWNWKRWIGVGALTVVFLLGVPVHASTGEAASLAGFIWGAPLFLWLLPVVALLIWWRLRSDRLKKDHFEHSAGSFIKSTGSFGRRLLVLPLLLRGLSMLLLVLALANPMTVKRNDETYVRGIRTITVLDISGSMDAKVAGNMTRLDVALDANRQFVRARSKTDDHIGIVTFSDRAYLDVGLDNDHDAILSYLGNMETEGSTALGEGINEAVRHFIEEAIDASPLPEAARFRQMLDSDEEGMTKVLAELRGDPDLFARIYDRNETRIIIAITDGDSNSGENPLVAAQYAKALGIKVFAIGATFGETTGLNEGLMREMAEKIGGGRYFRADSRQAMMDAFAEIDRLEPNEILSRTQVSYDEHRLLLALLALGFFGLEIVLASTRLRSAFFALLLAAGIGLPPSPDALAQSAGTPAVPPRQERPAQAALIWDRIPPVREVPSRAREGFAGVMDGVLTFANPYKSLPAVRRGNALYREGLQEQDPAAAQAKFRAALREYHRALEQDPDVPEIYFNIGSAYFRLGEHEAAIAAWQRALRAPDLDPMLKAQLHYDIGNAFVGRFLQERQKPEPDGEEEKQKHAERLMGLIQSAINGYKDALRIHTGYFNAKWNLEILIQAQQQSQGKGKGNQRGRPGDGQGQPGQGQGQGQGQPGQGNEGKSPQDALQGLGESSSGQDKAGRPSPPTGGVKNWMWLFVAVPLSQMVLSTPAFAASADGAASQGFSFSEPSLMYLLALVPVLVFVYAWGWVKRHRDALTLSARQVAQKFSQWTGHKLFVIKTALVGLALMFMVISAGGPQRGTVEEKLRFGGSDIMFVVDGSYSNMLAVDGRWSVTKHLIRRVADAADGGDRIGMVLFADDARLVSPLARKPRLIHLKLRRLMKEATRLDQNSHISAGVDLGVDAFNAAVPMGQRRRIMIVISDGEDASEALVQAVNKAEQNGVVIYSVMTGSGRAEMRLPGESAPLADGGSTIYTTPNPAALQQIAAETKGVFMEAPSEAAADAALENIAGRENAESYISVTRPRSLTPWALLLALFALTADLLAKIPGFFQSVGSRNKKPVPESKGPKGPGGTTLNSVAPFALFGAWEPAGSIVSSTWAQYLPYGFFFAVVLVLVYLEVSGRRLTRLAKAVWRRTRGHPRRGLERDLSKLFDVRDVDAEKLGRFLEYWKTISEELKKQTFQRLAEEREHLWAEKALAALLFEGDGPFREHVLARWSPVNRAAFNPFAEPVRGLLAKRKSFRWLNQPAPLTALLQLWYPPATDALGRRWIGPLLRHPDEEVAMLAREILEVAKPAPPRGRERLRENGFRYAVLAALAAALISTTYSALRTMSYPEAQREELFTAAGIFYGPENALVLRGSYEDPRIRTEVIPALLYWWDDPASQRERLQRALAVLRQTNDPKAVNILQVVLRRSAATGLSEETVLEILDVLANKGMRGLWLLEEYVREIWTDPAAAPRLLAVVRTLSSVEHPMALDILLLLSTHPAPAVSAAAAEAIAVSAARQQGRFAEALTEAIFRHADSEPYLRAVLPSIMSMDQAVAAEVLGRVMLSGQEKAVDMTLEVLTARIRSASSPAERLKAVELLRDALGFRKDNSIAVEALPAPRAMTILNDILAADRSPAATGAIAHFLVHGDMDVRKRAIALLDGRPGALQELSARVVATQDARMTAELWGLVLGWYEREAGRLQPIDVQALAYAFHDSISFEAAERLYVLLDRHAGPEGRRILLEAAERTARLLSGEYVSHVPSSIKETDERVEKLVRIIARHKGPETLRVLVQFLRIDDPPVYATEAQKAARARLRELIIRELAAYGGEAAMSFRAVIEQDLADQGKTREELRVIGFFGFRGAIRISVPADTLDEGALLAIIETLEKLKSKDVDVTEVLALFRKYPDDAKHDDAKREADEVLLQKTAAAMQRLSILAAAKGDPQTLRLVQQLSQAVNRGGPGLDAVATSLIRRLVEKDISDQGQGSMEYDEGGGTYWVARKTLDEGALVAMAQTLERLGGVDARSVLTLFERFPDDEKHDDAKRAAREALARLGRTAGLTPGPEDPRGPADPLGLLFGAVFAGLASQKRSGRVKLMAKRLATAQFWGAFGSVFRGRGMEYEESTPTQPGDELRHRDSKTTLRTGVPHTKRYREEREVPVMLVVDISRSSAFGTRESSKREIIQDIAAALALSTSGANMPVGLILITDQVQYYVPPSTGETQLRRIVDKIMNFEPTSDGTDLNAGLNRALRELGDRRGIVVVLSDFLATGYGTALAQVGKKHTLVPIVVTDPAERELPAAGWVRFTDAETGAESVADFSDAEVRSEYRRRIRQLEGEREDSLRRSRAVAFTVEADKPYFEAMVAYFKRMAIRGRTRHYLIGRTFLESMGGILASRFGEEARTGLRDTLREMGGLVGLDRTADGYALTYAPSLFRLIEAASGAPAVRVTRYALAHEHAHMLLDNYFDKLAPEQKEKLYDRFLETLENGPPGVANAVDALVQEYVTYEPRTVPLSVLARRFGKETVVHEALAVIYSIYFEGRESPLTSVSWLNEHIGGLDSIVRTAYGLFPGMEQFLAFRVAKSDADREAALGATEKWLALHNRKISYATDRRAEAWAQPLADGFPAGPAVTPLSSVQARAAAFLEKATRAKAEVRKIIVGQDRFVDDVFELILSGGHGLIEGMPGLAKTLAITTFAKTVSGRHQRVTFTPDLVPSDIVGTEIYNEEIGDYEVQHGPLLVADILIADEINRGTPKTQAGLLEGMQERQGTIGNTTYPASKRLLVLATQNPAEQEGTHPLPEAQRDRFAKKLIVGYPSEEEEDEIYRRTGTDEAVPIETVMSLEDIDEARRLLNDIYIDKALVHYIVRLVRATRPENNPALAQLVRFGASPRADLDLVRGAKARAIMSGRDHVRPEDITAIAPDVLRHRIELTYEAEDMGETADSIIKKLLTQVSTREEPAPARAQEAVRTTAVKTVQAVRALLGGRGWFASDRSARFASAGAALQALRGEVSRVVVGQKQAVDRAIAAAITGGHLLMEGPPGVAKTLLVNTFARTVGVSFKRIQFMPDLQPSDVVGSEVYNEKTQQNEVREGPIFAGFVLGDEINRATPKTQAATLEAMQEGQVTVGLETRKLPKPFLFFATQNQIEQEGTNPLPEAQRDRFMFHTNVGYPDFEDEVEVTMRMSSGRKFPVKQVVSGQDLLQLRKIVDEVAVDPRFDEFIVDIVRGTRPTEEKPFAFKKKVRFGASPRASIFLRRAAQAIALMDGRDSVEERDIRAAAPDVLRHRIGLTFEAEAEGMTPDDIVREVLENSVPLSRVSRLFGRAKKAIGAAADSLKEYLSAKSDSEEIAAAARLLNDWRGEVAKVMVGQDKAVESGIIGLLTGRHILFEGPPGIAKTLLANTMANATSLSFKRIQFVPDMQPMDLVGTPVFNKKTKKYEPRKGPLFHGHIILADEINRAPGKVHSSLLEVMQEGKATVWKEEYLVKKPFSVFATQNPKEQHGTHALPEAGLDRFLLQVNVGYPEREDEIEIARRMASGKVPDVQPVLSGDDILRLKKTVEKVKVPVDVRRYVTRLVRATRPGRGNTIPAAAMLTFGASPRAGMAFIRAARVLALLDGRDQITARDVDAVALDVLRHRVRVTPEAEAKDWTADKVLQQILRGAKSPLGIGTLSAVVATSAFFEHPMKGDPLLGVGGAIAAVLFFTVMLAYAWLRLYRPELLDRIFRTLRRSNGRSAKADDRQAAIGEAMTENLLPLVRTLDERFEWKARPRSVARADLGEVGPALFFNGEAVPDVELENLSFADSRDLLGRQLKFLEPGELLNLIEDLEGRAIEVLSGDEESPERTVGAAGYEWGQSVGLLWPSDDEAAAAATRAALLQSVTAAAGTIARRLERSPAESRKVLASFRDRFVAGFLFGSRGARVDVRARLAGAEDVAGSPADARALVFDLPGEEAQGYALDALLRAVEQRLQGGRRSPIAVVTDLIDQDARLFLLAEAEARHGAALTAEERAFYMRDLVIVPGRTVASEKRLSAGGVLGLLRAETGIPGLSLDVYTERARDWDLSGLSDADRRAVTILQLVNALVALDVTGLLDDLSEALKADRLVGTQA